MRLINYQSLLQTVLERLEFEDAEDAVGDEDVDELMADMD
jgi:hypothetical protein